MDDGLLSLTWNNHKATFLQVLSMLRRNAVFTDATLACDGKFYHTHKFVLSACSDYFKEIFKEITSSSVVVLKDISCHDLESLLDYMYIGEVDIKQKDLAGLVKSAEYLKIKGLATPVDIFPSKLNADEFLKEQPNKRLLQENNRNTINKKFKPNNDSLPKNTSANQSNNEPSQMDDFDTRQTLNENSPVAVYIADVKTDPELVQLEESKEIYLPDANAEVTVKYEDSPSLLAVTDGIQKLDNVCTDLNLKQDPGPSGIQEESTLIQWAENQPIDSIFEEHSNQQQMEICQRRLRIGVIYQCFYCLKRFRDKTKWTTHSRTHTGERPFQCPYCSYRASVKANMNRHITNVHYSIVSERHYPLVQLMPGADMPDIDQKTNAPHHLV